MQNHHNLLTHTQITKIGFVVVVVVLNPTISMVSNQKCFEMHENEEFLEIFFQSFKCKLLTLIGFLEKKRKKQNQIKINPIHIEWL